MANYLYAECSDLDSLECSQWAEFCVWNQETNQCEEINGGGGDISQLEPRRADYIEFGTTDYFDIFHANGGYHTQRSNNVTTNFKLGPVRLYNRALSETEIVQNYNA